MAPKISFKSGYIRFWFPILSCIFKWGFVIGCELTQGLVFENSHGTPYVSSRISWLNALKVAWKPFIGSYADVYQTWQDHRSAWRNHPTMKILDSCEESGNDVSCEEILVKSFLRWDSCEERANTISCEEILQRASCEEILAKSGPILLLAKRWPMVLWRE